MRQSRGVACVHAWSLWVTSTPDECLGWTRCCTEGGIVPRVTRTRRSHSAWSAQSAGQASAGEREQRVQERVGWTGLLPGLLLRATSGAAEQVYSHGRAGILWDTGLASMPEASSWAKVCKLGGCQNHAWQLALALLGERILQS